MPKLSTCSQGHQWEPTPTDTATFTAGQDSCPICGAASAENGLPETVASSAVPAGIREEAATLPYSPAKATDPYATQVTAVPSPPVAEAALPDLPVVPGYEILGLLGRGGMGVVYKAKQAKLNRIVALKMILSGSHAGPGELARFRTEAEAVARLQHPHIVQIYEISEAEGRPFFSMEFVGGGSLAQRLDGTGLPCRQAAQLVETLARAMHYAHEHGIVHRDLKPANVLLQMAIPKITDFGLAKKLDSDKGQTQTGDILGTPSYMAPEQAGGKREIGPAADVYALGAILFELLTGRPPFKAATALETLLQVMQNEPLPPSQANPEVPGDLEAICLKCLEKDPRQRYASAEALAEDIRRFLAGEPISTLKVGEKEWLAKWMQRAGYEIVEKLERGGMGVVYKARQVRLNRIVALKLLPAYQAGSQQNGQVLLARFRMEAEAVAQLQHPHIVQVYDFGEQNGIPYFSMEFIEGGSLAQKMGQPHSRHQAAELVRTLAQAIHYAHQRRIIHRDLKPANVLLCSDGTPKVADFGGVKWLEEKAQAPAEREGTLMGTASYMAPEQAAGNIGAVGPATDVYSLGAILYELLTGRPPFRGATALETIGRVISEEPVPPRRLQPRVARNLEAICLKCLQKEPGNRYASAEDLAKDLQRFLKRKRTLARPISFLQRWKEWAKGYRSFAKEFDTLVLPAVPILAMCALAGLLIWVLKLLGWLG